MKKFIQFIQNYFVKLSLSWYLLGIVMAAVAISINRTDDLIINIILLSAIGFPIVTAVFLLVWGIIRFIRNVTKYIHKNGYDNHVRTQIGFVINIVLFILMVSLVSYLQDLSVLGVMSLFISLLALVFGILNTINYIRIYGYHRFTYNVKEFHS